MAVSLSGPPLLAYVQNRTGHHVGTAMETPWADAPMREPRRQGDAYVEALVMSPQRAPVAVPTAPPTVAPRAGLPPTIAPTAAPPAAPMAPPLRARCCVGVMFAHPVLTRRTRTAM